MPFSLVTLNTWKGDGAYRERLRLTIQALYALKPDAIALQETFSAPGADADTATWLATHGGFHATQVQARPKPRSFEGRTVPSTSGMAVLSREPWLANEALPLPSSPADGGRAAQIITLPAGPHTVQLANLHLSHLPGPEGDALRALQLQTVLDRLLTLGPASATLLCGDFNSDLSSPALGGYLGEPWSLVDVFSLASQSREPTFVDESGYGQVLDHVLLVPGLSKAAVNGVASQTVLRCNQADEKCVTPSDHSGLWVRLSLG